MALKMTYFGSAALVLLVLAGWKLMARGAYESAEYTVIQSDGEFEIRKYPELTVVSTSMQFERQGKDGSFMRLFRYISGDNDAKQKISMTTPVFMKAEADSTDGQMAFVLPKDVAQKIAPQPSHEAVDVAKRPAGKYAVVRFSGYMNKQSIESAEQRLREWIIKSELTVSSNVEFAGYDPPWTPSLFRRNEILIQVVD